MCLDFLRLGWQDVERACREIAEEIRSRKLDGHMLVGISRGGLVPLRLISDYTASRRVSTLGVRFYEDLGRTAEEPEVFFPVQGDVSGRGVILVDDISDTGQSLIAAKKHLFDKGASEIVVATVCKKPHTKFDPDICTFETPRWVIFPWEVREAIKHITDSAEGRDEAEAELRRADISEDEYRDILTARFGGG